MERIQASKGHSLSREHEWIDKSGHGKNLSKQGPLTSWIAQMDGQVRIRKESKQVRGTHKLESTDRQSTQDIKSK